MGPPEVGARVPVIPFVVPWKLHTGVLQQGLLISCTRVHGAGRLGYLEHLQVNVIIKSLSRKSM